MIDHYFPPFLNCVSTGGALYWCGSFSFSFSENFSEKFSFSLKEVGTHKWPTEDVEHTSQHKVLISIWLYLYDVIDNQILSWFQI